MIYRRTDTNDIIANFFTSLCIKQIGSMLLCVCWITDQRRCQNVVTMRTHKFFCSYRILTSSVIYYWKDTQQHGTYLLNIHIVYVSVYVCNHVWYLYTWKSTKITNICLSYQSCKLIHLPESQVIPEVRSLQLQYSLVVSPWMWSSGRYRSHLLLK